MYVKAPLPRPLSVSNHALSGSAVLYERDETGFACRHNSGISVLSVTQNIHPNCLTPTRGPHMHGMPAFAMPFLDTPYALPPLHYGL